MGFLAYLHRVGARALDDVRASYLAWAVGTLSIGAGVGVYAWLGESFYWLAAALPGVAILVGFLRSAHREHVDVEVVVGKGIVVRLLEVDGGEHATQWRMPNGGLCDVWGATMHPGVEKKPIAWHWSYRLHIEVANNADRPTRLNFALWMSYRGELLTLEPKEGRDERHTVAPKDSTMVFFDASTESVKERTEEPFFDRLEVLDFATSPPTKLTLRLNSREGRIA